MNIREANGVLGKVRTVHCGQFAADEMKTKYLLDSNMRTIGCERAHENGVCCFRMVRKQHITQHRRKDTRLL